MKITWQKKKSNLVKSNYLFVYLEINLMNLSLIKSFSKS